LSNVKRLHNRALYRVDLDVTKRYIVYLEASTPKDIEREVDDVVNSDMYELATDYKPQVVGYTYSSNYITCEDSFDEFVREQETQD